MWVQWGQFWILEGHMSFHKQMLPSILSAALWWPWLQKLQRMLALHGILLSSIALLSVLEVQVSAGRSLKIIVTIESPEGSFGDMLFKHWGYRQQTIHWKKHNFFNNVSPKLKKILCFLKSTHPASSSISHFRIYFLKKINGSFCGFVGLSSSHPWHLRLPGHSVNGLARRKRTMWKHGNFKMLSWNLEGNFRFKPHLLFSLFFLWEINQSSVPGWVEKGHQYPSRQTKWQQTLSLFNRRISKNDATLKIALPSLSTSRSSRIFYPECGA